MQHLHGHSERENELVIIYLYVLFDNVAAKLIFACLLQTENRYSDQIKIFLSDALCFQKKTTTKNKIHPLAG